MVSGVIDQVPPLGELSLGRGSCVMILVSGVVFLRSYLGVHCQGSLDDVSIIVSQRNCPIPLSSDIHLIRDFRERSL